MKAFFRSILTQFRSLSRPARLFILALFFDGLLFAAFNLFFNLYIIDAGYSRDFLGLINAAPSLSALLLGVPIGLLSDRMGRKPAMIVGFILANVSILGMLVFHSESLLLILALAYGLFGQLFLLSQAPFMMKTSDDKTRDLLFSLSYGMIPLANTVGNFVAGYLPGLLTRWLGLAGPVEAYRAAMVFGTLSSFLVLVPIALIKEPKGAGAVKPSAEAKADADPPKASVWKVLVRPQTIKFSLPNLVIGLGAAIMVPYLNVFFAERHHMSDADLGLLFSLGSLLIGIACILGPRLVGNLGGKVRTIVAGQATSLVFLLVIGFSPYAWLAMLGFLVRGALMNMVAPLFDAYALERTVEAEHGMVNSIRNLAWNVGWAVGPYLSGLVQQRWGFSPIFISTAILYGLGIGLTWIFFKPQPEGERLAAIA